MEQIVSEALINAVKAQEAFVNESRKTLIDLACQMVKTLRQGGKILIFGNGGSAADAQHMAAEFVNRFLINRRPMAAIALTTDTSTITSIGNDFSFDEIFAKQVQALGKPEDLALGISTSGGSVNVIRAIEAAKTIGMRTAALTGGVTGDGGEVGRLADLTLNVPAVKTQHIQEVHLFAEHLLCELVEREIFGEV
ncbi:MAG: SIS domain-containing protein [Desulfocapsa sp.]|uniref:Phosphoheptose isomerase n=1 Tax=Desulfotalea psychrophila TaxID=84980 RepID=A0ABS3AT61_9BACT|nr:SIS domain-containing protein [Desulfocapsa sp.]MBN4045906.1 SIS domain-containing protein [bacterium AH-315-P11]MBN4058658.1 SIS domain-containing protein [Desulfocapsa sp. AH-315-J15]MBN4060096.1 SIS domain-containing protein [Desulfotalea psychrophila]MBN4068294.1 SIS domain-containing protein [Desulfotalea psychrophila]